MRKQNAVTFPVIHGVRKFVSQSSIARAQVQTEDDFPCECCQNCRAPNFALAYLTVQSLPQTTISKEITTHSAFHEKAFDKNYVLGGVLEEIKNCDRGGRQGKNRGLPFPTSFPAVALRQISAYSTHKNLAVRKIMEAMRTVYAKKRDSVSTRLKQNMTQNYQATYASM